MADQPDPRRSRRRLVVGAAAVALVVIGAIVIAVLGRGAPTSAPTPQQPATSGTSTAPSATKGSTSTPPAPTTTASGGPTTATPTAGTSTSAQPDQPSATPTAQPTKTAKISKPTAVPIRKELSATVLKLEAVKGKADGPGEVGGPSVRFTITITNTTGRRYSLSNTVVNAAYGSDQTPAVPLRSPGGKNFPTSVKDGASATGVYIFNIPKADRSDVRVTLDTDVQNPVIAFEGAAPRS